MALHRSDFERNNGSVRLDSKKYSWVRNEHAVRVVQSQPDSGAFRVHAENDEHSHHLAIPNLWFDSVTT